MPIGKYRRTTTQREQCAKIGRISHKGYQHTEDAKQRIAAFQQGRPRSAATRAKISAFRGPKRYQWNERGLALRRGRVFVRLYSGWLPRAHVVWVQANGPIPEPGLMNRYCRRGAYLIHHEDENPLNDALDNLRLMTWQGHLRHHSAKRGKLWGRNAA